MGGEDFGEKFLISSTNNMYLSSALYQALLSTLGIWQGYVCVSVQFSRSVMSNSSRPH